MAGHTENSVVIAAPLQLVWDLTNDVDGWTDLFTEYAAAEVMERRGNTIRFRLTLHPDEEGRVWSWVSERTLNPDDHTVHAHRLEKGPFAYMQIFWRYEEVPEGTRMTWIQDFSMKPQAPVDDAGMTKRLNTNSPVQMDAIRRRIEERAKARAAAGAQGK
ncbi:SRPBCC family protein [Streptomyces xiaopingdaonensis]|uniref:SRPBCC family protein n=1 Tax=Streptomyces xiaopingdaonensis TaxID=1565415 RepID=UPI0002D72EE3|nr:SRPBCC family protein [Streptomyces xiaopingdaonensis]